MTAAADAAAAAAAAVPGNIAAAVASIDAGVSVRPARLSGQDVPIPTHSPVRRTPADAQETVFFSLVAADHFCLLSSWSVRPFSSDSVQANDCV